MSSAKRRSAAPQRSRRGGAAKAQTGEDRCSEARATARRAGRRVARLTGADVDVVELARTLALVYREAAGWRSEEACARFARVQLAITNMFLDENDQQDGDG